MKKSIPLLALGTIALLAPATASADDCRHSSRRYVTTHSYYVPQVRYAPPVRYYYEEPRHVYHAPRYDCYGRRIVVGLPGIRIGGYIRLR